MEESAPWWLAGGAAALWIAREFIGAVQPLFHRWGRGQRAPDTRWRQQMGFQRRGDFLMGLLAMGPGNESAPMVQILPSLVDATATLGVAHVQVIVAKLMGALLARTCRRSWASAAATSP